MQGRETRKMPSLAKAYIATITALAAALLAVVAQQWNPTNFAHFAPLFALAMLASAMKIRLPGFKSTISANFVFILVGIALFSFGETVLIGLGGALVQSLWNTQNRPKAVQVLFNGACLTVCAAAAYWVSHILPTILNLNSVAVMIVVGACVYVALNTGLVSLVISLSERSSLKQIWPSCYEWTFPYFLVGAAVAGLASVASHGSNFGTALIVLAVMYFVHVYHRLRMIRAVLDNVSAASQTANAVLAEAYQDR
jgi:hypothetical protein